MIKLTKAIRVDSDAYNQAREAGLCVSRIASKALRQAAAALEAGTTTRNP